MRNPLDVIDIAETVGLKTWDAFVTRACCDKKEVFLNGGWRGGKSSSGAFLVFIDIITKWLLAPGSHLVWLVGPDYAQARQEYFYLQEWSTRLGLAVESSTAMQGPLGMTIGAAGMPGRVEVATKQAGDPTSLGSVAPVVILACEAGQFSEEAMLWLYGRTAEKNATLIWSGTFENEEGKAQYAWFEEASERAWTLPSPRQSAFRLPTWDNLSLYDSCLKMIQDDPSLIMWCPDASHGPQHAGLSHPMIRKLQDQWKDRPRDWRKRFGGETVGLENMVYEWSALDRIDDISGNKYLISMSEVQRRSGQFIWTFTAGGVDPGLTHPAGVVVTSKNQHGDLWARNAKRLKSSNNADLYALKDLWQQEYRILMWGGDPVGLKYSRPTENIIPMTGSLWSREERAAIVNSYAVGIDNQQHLYFDADMPGNRELFAEYKTIHRKKRSDGQWGYNRDGDDMVAAHENTVAIIRSREFSMPQKMGLRRPTPRRQYTLVTPRRGL